MKLSIIIPVYNNEDSIAKTIQSILKQSFQDFEVILINDGSTDNSQSIIDQFASQDQRIVCINQENQGVSSARNRGLEIAQGEFVYFVDGDDLLPKDSLTHMNQISNVDDCDVIAGIYERIDGVTPYTNGKAKHLCKKTARIDKEDIEMLFSWSLCNKWFRKSIIDEHHLRFEQYSHFEDAVFLYSYLVLTDKISSCPYLVYTYRKPLANIGRTTTQSVSIELLEDSYNAFLRIQTITKSFSNQFQEVLKRRYISSLIGDYYRRVWVLEEDFRERVYCLVCELYSQLSEQKQLDVNARYPDIFKDGELCSITDILDSPLVTIVVDGMSCQFINDYLYELYDQMMILFVVEIEEHYRESIDPYYLSRKNIHFYERNRQSDIVRNSKSQFIALADSDVLYDHRALFTMTKRMVMDEGLDFVALRLYTIDHGNIRFNEIGDLVYNKGLLEFDYIHSNKLYRRKIAEKIVSEGESVYQKYQYAILDKPCMIDYRTEEETITRAPKQIKQKYKSLKRDEKVKKLKKSLKNRMGVSHQKSDESLKQKKEITLRSKRYSAYYNQEIVEDTVLIESLEKSPKGSALYLLKVLSSAKYSDFTIYFVVNDSTEEITQKILDFNKINGINLINIDSDDYIKSLFSVKYLINEVYFPGWWIKKAGQIYVNIWHGTPLKKLGKDKMQIIHHDANAERNFAMADYLLFPSEYTRDRILSAYGVNELSSAKEIMIGYPRTGVLFDNDIRKKVKEDCHLGEKKVIAWMPTWNDNLSEEVIIDFLINIDKKLKDDQVLIIKLHRNTETPVIDYTQFRHVEPFSDVYDTYEMLSATDVLITDYSSVFFDFAVTRRKIILHCPDFDQYVQDRGLYLDIYQLPFPITNGLDDLVKEINTPIQYDDNEFLLEYNSRDSIHNAEDLCEIVFSGQEAKDKIRQINPMKNEITFFVSDGFSDERTNEELYGLLQSEKWDKHMYLSFVVRETDENIDRVDFLLRQVPIYATRNYILDERSEYMRLFWNMNVKEFFLLDTTNPKRIRCFARFSKAVHLFITKEACEKMLNGDQKLINAVLFFEKHANGLFSFTESIALRVEELLGVKVAHVDSLQDAIEIARISKNDLTIGEE